MVSTGSSDGPANSPQGSSQPDRVGQEESINISRIQLLLAEKRTSLAAMRTGIAIFTIPLSVVTVLVTTSRYYNFIQNLHYLIPLLLLCLVLVVVGTILIVNSLVKFHHQGTQIEAIKDRYPHWKNLID